LAILSLVGAGLWTVGSVLGHVALWSVSHGDRNGAG
jgi:hypothetical protein